MPKLATLAVVLENGLAMNLRTSPKLAKKAAANPAAEIKATKVQTMDKLKMKVTRNNVKEAPR